jgi:FG-GAP-like repeat
VRRALGVVLTAALALPGGQSRAAEEYADTHPPAGVVRRQSPGATEYEASVRGPLLDWAVLERGDGRREIYILGAVEDDPQQLRSLYRVDLTTPGLELVSAELPTPFDRLAALDVDGDGEDDLLLGRPGHLFRVTPPDGSRPAAWTELAGGGGLDLGAALSLLGAAAPPSELVLPTVGALRRLVRDEGSAWELASRPLAVSASRHRYGLRLSTPPSTRLALPAGEVIAVGPEAVGSHRLRSRLVAATGETRDVWSRLPGPESVQSSSFHVLDGRPVLVVSTNSADKLGILERQQLRLFSLYEDSTRAGVGPWLSRPATSRRWQPIESWVLDIDGDGDDDLVVAQLDGLGGGETRIEAFINSGRRGFEARPRATAIERPAAAWHLGADLTGDGLSDLVVLAAGALEVYPTLAAGAPRLTERRPRWSIAGSDIPRVAHSVAVGERGVAVSDERPSRIGRPTTLDLDGDGRAEILLAENPRWGFGRLRIVFLATP